MEKLIYSSRTVLVNDKIQVYSHEDERYIKAERLTALIMISTRNERLKIRDYNQQFNPERR